MDSALEEIEQVEAPLRDFDILTPSNPAGNDGFFALEAYKQESKSATKSS